jgi:hypothetical protein
MLVNLAVAFDPCVEFALEDGKPADEMRDRDIGFIAPGPDKINYGVSRIMGNPDAG